jgi:hypothetical protein
MRVRPTAENRIKCSDQTYCRIFTVKRPNNLTPIYLVIAAIGAIISFLMVGTENAPVKISLVLGALVVIFLAMEIYMGAKDLGDYSDRKQR